MNDITKDIERAMRELDGEYRIRITIRRKNTSSDFPKIEGDFSKGIRDLDRLMSEKLQVPFHLDVRRSRR